MRVFVFSSVNGQLTRRYDDVRRIVRNGGFLELWRGERLIASFPEATPWQAIVPYCAFCLFAGTPNESLCYCCDYATQVDGSDS